MSDIIKLCPFCGHPATINHVGSLWWVSCDERSCGCGPSRDTFAEAISAWNAAPRATEPASNTVRVRVAVSVSPNGNWLASGGRYDTDAFAERAVKYEPGDRLVWLVRDIPLPEPAAEIEAEIEP